VNKGGLSVTEIDSPAIMSDLLESPSDNLSLTESERKVQLDRHTYYQTRVRTPRVLEDSLSQKLIEETLDSLDGKTL